MTPHRWVMKEPGTPLTRVEFDLQEPLSNEVIVEIAGCGVCHTDLGFFYDGVRTKHPLPLALGHEISGRVIKTGEDAAAWQDKTVVIPAVIPCGSCDLCDRGRGTICRKQKSPGIDMHGGFATHITVPSAGLCAIDTARLAEVDMELADASVVADALTTPYQAVVQAEIEAGDLAVRKRSNGRCDRHRSGEARSARGTRRQPENKRNRSTRQGYPRRHTAIREGQRSASNGMEDFRMFRYCSRSNHCIWPADLRFLFVRRRFYDGQGRSSPVQPDGISCACTRQLGMPAGALPGCARAGPDWQSLHAAVHRTAPFVPDQ